MICSSSSSPSSISLLPPSPFSGSWLPPAIREFQLHLSRLLGSCLAEGSTMSFQSMPFYINLSSEHNKLLLFALRLFAQKVVLVKVLPQVPILSVKILKAISVTEMTEIMIFPQMFKQFFIVYEPLITKLT